MNKSTILILLDRKSFNFVGGEVFSRKFINNKIISKKELNYCLLDWLKNYSFNKSKLGPNLL